MNYTRTRKLSCGSKGSLKIMDLARTSNYGYAVEVDGRIVEIMLYVNLPKGRDEALESRYHAEAGVEAYGFTATLRRLPHREFVEVKTELLRGAGVEPTPDHVHVMIKGNIFS